MSIIQASVLICENDDTNSDRGYGAMRVKRRNKTVARVCEMSSTQPLRLFYYSNSGTMWCNQAALKRKEQQVLINKILQSILNSSGSQ